VRRADNLATLICRLSWNIEASTSWNSQGLFRPVMGLLYLYLTYFCYLLLGLILGDPITICPSFLVSRHHCFLTNSIFLILTSVMTGEGSFPLGIFPHSAVILLLQKSFPLPFGPPQIPHWLACEEYYIDLTEMGCEHMVWVWLLRGKLMSSVIWRELYNESQVLW